jgi:hypothetical protein
VRLSRSRKSREHSGHSTVAARYVENEPPPAGGGLEGFETPEAHRINRARLEHLASLGLSLEGRSVLDVGSGPGHLAQFFVERGCRDYQFDWKDDLATERDGHLLRAIFVASRAPVDNDRLVPLVKAS